MNRRPLLLALASLAAASASFRAVSALGTDYQVIPTSAPQVSCAIILTGTQTNPLSSGASGTTTAQLAQPTVAFSVTGPVEAQYISLDAFSLVATGPMSLTGVAGDTGELVGTLNNYAVNVPVTTWLIDPLNATNCLVSLPNADGTFPYFQESFDYSISLLGSPIGSGSVSGSFGGFQWRICFNPDALYSPPFNLDLAGGTGDYVLGPLGHFTGQFGPNTVDWTISAECSLQTGQFDVPPPTTTTTTLPPSTGTTWRLTIKERETCCAGGRCEGDSGGFSSSLVLESDGTYRASETCLTTGGVLPDSVGEVRSLSRRRFALLTPTNLDEIAEASRECHGYDSLVLRAFRNRLKIAKDGLSLRGTLSYAGRYSQSGTVVACRVSGSYRGTLSK